jgi:hypothetical protein
MSQDNVFYGKVTSTDLAGTALQFGIKTATEGWFNKWR